MSDFVLKQGKHDIDVEKLAKEIEFQPKKWNSLLRVMKVHMLGNAHFFQKHDILHLNSIILDILKKAKDSKHDRKLVGLAYSMAHHLILRQGKKFSRF